MDWSNFSKPDFLREVTSLLEDTVTAYRNRGYTRASATQQAAEALGTTPRRARALLYGEAFYVAADEYRSFKQRYLLHLDAEAAHLTARSAAVRARRDQIRDG